MEKDDTIYDYSLAQVLASDLEMTIDEVESYLNAEDEDNNEQDRRDKNRE